MEKFYIKLIQGRLLSTNSTPIDIYDRCVTDSRGNKLNWYNVPFLDDNNLESFSGMASISVNFKMNSPSNEMEKILSEKISEITKGQNISEYRFYGDFIFGEILLNDTSKINNYALL